jgi:hypothetical protein
MSDRKDGDWFAPSSHGYGAGLPISWQGWAVLGGYLLFALGMAGVMEWDREIGLPVGVAGIGIATVVVILIAKRHTKGGWRWRWGEDDDS